MRKMGSPVSLLYATVSTGLAPSETDSSDHVPVENERDELAGMSTIPVSLPAHHAHFPLGRGPMSRSQMVLTPSKRPRPSGK
jgi:hypothetical protein